MKRHVLVGMTLLATPLPWLAETLAVRALQHSVGHCGDGSWGCGGIRALSLDAGGLRLKSAWRTARGMTVSAEAVEVRPTWDGIEVHIDGLGFAEAQRVELDAPAEPTKPTTPTAPPPAPRVNNRGIPIRVVAVGTHALEHRGVVLKVHDPVIDVGTDGGVRATFDADVARGGVWASSRRRLRARPVSGWTHWSVGGEVLVADGHPLALAAAVDRGHAEIELSGDEDGTLRLRLDLQRRRVDAELTGFRPAALGALARGERYDLADATFDGALTVTRGPTWTVEIPTLIASGVTLEHDKLAREPVAFGSLLLTGRGEYTDADTFRGQLAVEHDGVSLQLATRREGGVLRIEAGLAPTTCQALLDAVPQGMAGVVRGAKLEGEIEGELDVEVHFSELPSWERRLADNPDDPGPPPGHLAVNFPFLEACRVVGDPPDVDFTGLQGPYRHTFVDGNGRTRTRVMAPGAEGFRPLWHVQLAAAAFVTLEDCYYKRHDGFDRTQMENALWHNFQVGRISRGASTISQQLARNLFLGVDRSISRKLQEALLTARLEAELSKSRILELYVNLIELGPGVHGVEDAAQFYFGKSAHDLDIPQAIHLAMLAPAPHAYSERFASGEVDDAWLDEIRSHIRRLASHGDITLAQMRAALRQDLDLLDRRTRPSTADG